MQMYSSPRTDHLSKQFPDEFVDSAPGHDVAEIAPILIVDDDRSVRSTVSEILEIEGYTVATAIDGIDALRKLDRVRPALILLDIQMAGLDGPGFVRQLRGRGLNLPILVMTADQGGRRWAESVGADGYLTKPFDLDDLLKEIARLLRAPEPPAIH